MSDSTSNEISGGCRADQNIAYIRQMLAELRSVAETEKAEMLCYLIEMAFMEAGDLIETRKRLGQTGKSGARA